jgi:hypothetical protein
MPDSELLSQVALQVRTQTKPYLRTEAKSKLAELRDSLPDEDRTLLVLRIDKGMEWKDLARVMLGEEAEVSDAQLTIQRSRGPEGSPQDGSVTTRICRQLRQRTPVPRFDAQRLDAQDAGAPQQEASATDDVQGSLALPLVERNPHLRRGLPVVLEVIAPLSPASHRDTQRLPGPLGLTRRQLDKVVARQPHHRLAVQIASLTRILDQRSHQRRQLSEFSKLPRARGVWGTYEVQLPGHSRTALLEKRHALAQELLRLSIVPQCHGTHALARHSHSQCVRLRFPLRELSRRVQELLRARAAPAAPKHLRSRGSQAPARLGTALPAPSCRWSTNRSDFQSRTSSVLPEGAVSESPLTGASDTCASSLRNASVEAPSFEPPCEPSSSLTP